MATYKSRYTGEEIDEAVGKALADNGGSGGSGGSKLYLHLLIFSEYSGPVYAILNTNAKLTGLTLVEIVNDYVIIPCTYGESTGFLLYREYSISDAKYHGKIKRLDADTNPTTIDGICTNDEIVISI